MQQHLRHQLWIALAATIAFFTNLGATHLWDEDETLHATCAREMAERGDWVVPTFNGKLFPDKPPLMFWLMISAYKLLGMTELAARLWSAVLGVGTALITYHLGRLLFRAEVGFWAGLIMTSTVAFTVSARAATVDSALVFASTLALLAFVAGAVQARRTAGDPRGLSEGPSPNGFLPGGRLSFVLLYAAMGVAVLAKGPVGFLLPVASLGLFLLAINRAPAAAQGAKERPRNNLGTLPVFLATVPVFAQREWDCPLRECGSYPSAAPKRQAMRDAEDSQARVEEGDPPIAGEGVEPGLAARWVDRLAAIARVFAPGKLWRAAWQLRPLTALVVVGAIALPWYVMVGLRTDGEFLAKFLGEHNFQRALRPLQSHSGTVFYYVPAILIGMFPWSVFLGPSLVDFVRRIRRRDPWRAGLVLLACWMGVFFVFWSLVGTKLPHYVLPMYPAMAMMTALFLDRLLNEPAGARDRWLKTGVISVIGVGICILAAVPILARFFLPGEGLLGLWGLILVVGGGWCCWLQRRGERRRTLAAFSVMSLAFVTAIFGFAALRVDRHQNAPSLLAAIRRANSGPVQLVGYRFLKESLVWTAGGPIPRFNRIEDLRHFLASAENPCVLTLSSREEELEQAFPGMFYVLARERNFLRSDDVFALARRPSSAQVAGGGQQGSGERR